MSAKKKWYQQKTLWTGLAAITGGIAGIVTGQIDTATGVQTIIGGFAVIFLRQAVNG